MASVISTVRGRARGQASANTETTEAVVLKTYIDRDGNVTGADVRLHGLPRPLTEIANASGIKIWVGMSVMIAWTRGSRFAPVILQASGAEGGAVLSSAATAATEAGQVDQDTGPDLSGVGFLLVGPDETVPDAYELLPGANTLFEDTPPGTTSGGAAVNGQRVLTVRPLVTTTLPAAAGSPLPDGTLLDLVDGSGNSVGMYRLDKSATAWVRRDVGSGGGFVNPMTTAGDIIVGGVSGVATRVAKGGNNTVWGVDASGVLGYKADPAGGSAHVIQEEGAPLTARAALNFKGALVTVTDNAVTGASDVTVASGTSAPTPVLFPPTAGGSTYSIGSNELAGGVYLPLLLVSSGVACGGNSGGVPLLSVGEWACYVKDFTGSYTDATTLGSGAFVQRDDSNSGTAFQQASFDLVRIDGLKVYGHTGTNTRTTGANLELGPLIQSPTETKVLVKGAGTLSLLEKAWAFDVYRITAVTNPTFKQYTADRYRCGMTVGPPITPPAQFEGGIFTGGPSGVKPFIESGFRQERRSKVVINTTVLPPASASVEEVFMRVDCTGGNRTITVNAADFYNPATGKSCRLFLQRENGGSNTITVAAAASQTINDVASVQMSTQYQVLELFPYSTNAWWIL